MGTSIGDLRAVFDEYVLEFGEKKARRVWCAFGGTGQPLEFGSFPPKDAIEPLCHALCDELSEHKDKRSAAYNHATNINATVQQLTALCQRLRQQPFVSTLDEDGLKGWIAELEVDYKLARRLYLSLRPKA